MHKKFRNILFGIIAIILLITLAGCGKKPQAVRIVVSAPTSVVNDGAYSYDGVKVYRIMDTGQILQIPEGGSGYTKNIKPISSTNPHLYEMEITDNSKPELKTSYKYIINNGEVNSDLSIQDKVYTFYTFRFNKIEHEDEKKNPNDYIFLHNVGYAFDEDKLNDGLELVKVQFNDDTQKFEEIKVPLTTDMIISEGRVTDPIELEKDKYANIKYKKETYKVSFNIESNAENNPGFDVTVLGGQNPINYKSSTWFDWVLVNWVAWIMQLTSFGGYFSVGILFTTIIVRTLAWPIYAKTNSMSARMNEAQPEIQRLQRKYQGRTDKQSQQMMQMEMAKLYKKHKIGMSSMLMPFLQMPIFIAVYQTVNRITLPGGMYADKVYKTTSLLGIDLTTGMSDGVAWVSILLAGVVGITMFLLQYLSSRKPSYLKKTTEKNKQNDPQANQQAKTMKIVSVVMIAMMIIFSLQGNAIAFYWIIGNLFSLFQTSIHKYGNKKAYLAKQNADLFGTEPKKTFKEKLTGFFKKDKKNANVVDAKVSKPKKEKKAPEVAEVTEEKVE